MTLIVVSVPEEEEEEENPDPQDTDEDMGSQDKVAEDTTAQGVPCCGIGELYSTRFIVVFSTILIAT